MQRVVAHEARIIHLAWCPERKLYEFRLMYGRRFLTPKLWLGPLDWYALIEGRHVVLEGWVNLSRRGRYLVVTPKRDLVYAPSGEPVPPEWPGVSFGQFYDVAKLERGDSPEAGWAEAYETQLEAKRDQWGGA